MQIGVANLKRKMTDIFQIIRRGSESAYLEAIKSIDVNIVDEDGQGLLHQAIASQKEDIVYDLLSKNVDVNIQDGVGQTALHYAAMYRMPEVAKGIIAHGANVNSKDNYGNTALWTATFNVKGKHYECVQIILDSGGDPYSKNLAGRSPLDFAKQVKNAKLVSMLSFQKQ